MPALEDDPESLNAASFDYSQSSLSRPSRSASTSPFPSQSAPSRSQYHLAPSEQLKGVANRIIHSRYYMLFYAAMMGLSMATLVLSLKATHRKECPPVAWHIIEVVLNGLMVLEVTTRWVAYGKKFPWTLLNVVDLALVFFCMITLIMVFANPCSSGTRNEELLDTILLITRNTIQFLRLASILRRSGHSWFRPPRAIDLSQARAASRALDFDVDEELEAERYLGSAPGGLGALGTRSLVGSGGGRYEYGHDEERDAVGHAPKKGTGVEYGQGRETLSEEDGDAWDRLG